MADSSASSAKTSTAYQQKKILCFCQRCWEQTGGKGKKIPRYTERKHATEYPRTSVAAPTGLDPRYRAQPFGRPSGEPRKPATAHETALQAQELPPGFQAAAASVEGPKEKLAEAGDEGEQGRTIEGGGDGTMEVNFDWFPDVDMDDASGDDAERFAAPAADAAASFADSPDDTAEHITGASQPLSLSTVLAIYSHRNYHFDIQEINFTPQDILQGADATFFWRIILLLVAWLHLTYRLPFHACDLVLSVLKLVFSLIKAFPPEHNAITTLSTTFWKLELADTFLIMPMCPSCCKIVPHDSPFDSVCPGCSSALFERTTAASRNFGIRNEYEDINNKDAKIILKLPFNPISRQLSELLNREGMEEQIDAWRTRVRKEGEMQDIMDGEVWKTFPGPDGKLFFDNDPDRASKNELRIGITLRFDGFGYQTSKNAASYSSDVLSCCIANLPIQLKCLTRNLLLISIFPGPKAPDGEQTQYILAPFTDDLLKLFEDGIMIKTRRYPEGRLVRVVLVAVCCDHPALCKVVGFADHNHSNRFCTKCMIGHSELFTKEGLTNGFPARTGEEHRRLGFEYLEGDDEDRETIHKEFGLRYTELIRLPYFDAVRMTVIDPMHNVLLGIMKSQWHDSWIKTNMLRERTKPNQVQRELDLLNSYLKEFEMPSWVGRLPSNVGYPAAGSLSADEYKALALVYLPVIVPFVWEEWQPVAQKELDKKTAKWRKSEAAKQMRKDKGKMVKDDDNEPSPKPTIRMHADDTRNFLKLSAALKITLARSIRECDLARAKDLLGEYLQGYLEIHCEDVKPNFHWVTHIFDQIRDYGPVYGFWSFTYKWLNKTLKSYRTNNHGGGEIETAFMRAFMRDAKLRELVKSLARLEGGDLGVKQATQLLLDTDSDNRGTIAAVAREIDEAAQDVGRRFSLGPGSVEYLTNSLQRSLVKHYCEQQPQAAVLSRNARVSDNDAIPAPNFLRDTAVFHKYIILNGRRIMPSSDIYKAPNSIIQTRFGATVYVGQVTHILTHAQPHIDEPSTLLHVQWFLPLRPHVLNTSIWDNLPELEIGFFEFNSYLDNASRGPPALIFPEDVVSQACRVRILYRPPRDSDDSEEEEEEAESFKLWVTVGLTKDAVVI